MDKAMLDYVRGEGFDLHWVRESLCMKRTDNRRLYVDFAQPYRVVLHEYRCGIWRTSAIFFSTLEELETAVIYQSLRSLKE